MNADGTDLRPYIGLSGNGTSARLPTWSSDGSHIAFKIREAGGTFGAFRLRIWIVDTATDSLTQIRTGGTARKPEWSPLFTP